MGDIQITASTWRLVEVGRVVLFSTGPYIGRLATIVEIVDHKRVLVDGPAGAEDRVVPRHVAPLANVSLTAIVIPKLPRGARNGPIRKAWEKSEVDKQWEATTLAKNRDRSAKRRKLTDFERFKVMRLRKQARYEVRREVAQIRRAAKA